MLSNYWSFFEWGSKPSHILSQAVAFRVAQKSNRYQVDLEALFLSLYALLRKSQRPKACNSSSENFAHPFWAFYCTIVVRSQEFEIGVILAFARKQDPSLWPITFRTKECNFLVTSLYLWLKIWVHFQLAQVFFEDPLWAHHQKDIEWFLAYNSTKCWNQETRKKTSPFKWVFPKCILCLLFSAAKFDYSLIFYQV